MKEINIITPESVIKKIYLHMSLQSWLAALAAVVVGYVTHIFILTNELFNHDDIGAWMQPRSEIMVTRWFQSIFSHLVSPIGSGVMAGSLTIIILSISALLLVDTLQIKSKVFSIIIGIMMVSSPIVASFMSYLNGSYLFCIGIPFAILSARWYERGKKGFIFAALSLMCAIAGYQSNIAITIAVMYIILFGRLLEKDIKLKKWWLSFAKAFTVLIIGIVLYIISNKIVVGITGDGGLSGEKGYSIGITTNELSIKGYEGQKETGKLYVGEIAGTVKTAVKYYIKYNFNTFFDGANISFASKLNVLSSIILLIVYLLCILSLICKQQNAIHKVLVFIVSLMAPLCINSTEIMLNGKCTESLQMMYSMIMTAPLILSVLEKSKLCVYDLKEQKRNFFGFGESFYNLLLNVVAVSFVFHIYGNIQIINDSYQRMNSEYETAYSEMTRIIDRVEQLPEWQEGNRVLYFDFKKGYLINKNYQSFVEPYESYIDMKWMGIFGTGVYNFWKNENISNYVKCYFGLEFESPTNEQIEQIKKSYEYDSMEQFPSVNSVKYIDGVIVVRMDETEN